MNLNIKKLSDHTGAEINNINLNKIYDEDIFLNLIKHFKSTQYLLLEIKIYPQMNFINLLKFLVKFLNSTIKNLL